MYIKTLNTFKKTLQRKTGNVYGQNISRKCFQLFFKNLLLKKRD